MARDSTGPRGEPQYAGSGVPQDAADLSEVAAFAASVGTRLVGTTAERTDALSDPDIVLFEGVEWRDTTQKRTYVFEGGAWALHENGAILGTSTNSQGVIVVSHGLSATPKWITTANLQGGGGDATRSIGVVSYDATSIRFVVWNNGSPLPGNPVNFSWNAGY